MMKEDPLVFDEQPKVFANGNIAVRHKEHSAASQGSGVPLEAKTSDMQHKDKESALGNVNKNNVGLWSARALVFIFLWYFFSALTLFLNKYILATMHGDPVLLSEFSLHFVSIFDSNVC